MNAHETVCQSTPILLKSKTSEQARSLLPPSIQLSSPTPQLATQPTTRTRNKKNRVATLNPRIVFKPQASRASVLAAKSKHQQQSGIVAYYPTKPHHNSKNDIKPQQTSERDSMKHQRLLWPNCVPKTQQVGFQRETWRQKGTVSGERWNPQMEILWDQRVKMEEESARLRAG